MARGRLILPIAEPLLDADGAPVTGATLSFYEDGLTSGTLATIYAEESGGSALANPQTSDSAGRFYDQSTEFWADTAMAYGAVVALTDGSTLTYENLYVLGAATNISGLAPINSPTFTGVPQAPTPATNDDSAKIATTAYVQAQHYAPLASPTFTGVPAGPTAAVNTNTTQIATTAFVIAQISGSGTAGYYQSGNLTVTPGSNGTLSHGLGVNPKRVGAFMVCTAAINGVAIGDVIPVGLNHDQAGEHGPQVSVVNDSTTLKYQFPASTILVLNTSGVAFNATSSNFVMVVRAWA